MTTKPVIPAWLKTGNKVLWRYVNPLAPIVVSRGVVRGKIKHGKEVVILGLNSEYQYSFRPDSIREATEDDCRAHLAYYGKAPD